MMPTQRITDSSTRPNSQGNSGTTLVEVMIFGAIASFALIAAVGLLTQGTRLLDVARRTSSSQGELRILLETLASDVEELAYLPSGRGFDSTDPDQNDEFSFVVLTDRTERGLEQATIPEYRTVEYRLGPPSGPRSLRVCSRRVSPGLEAAPASMDEPVAQSVLWLKLSPRVAVRHSASGGADTGPSLALLRPDDPLALEGDATTVLITVDVGIGEAGDEATKLEEQATTAMTTKLWCRNRLILLGRESR